VPNSRFGTEAAAVRAFVVILVEVAAAVVFPARRAEILDQLTERERDVLGCLGAGLSNAQIARQLLTSEATVKTHVSRVLAKLDLRSGVQAAILAQEAGLVPKT
jgi:DNA-binding NarL/FixJ family response regulator